MRHVYQWSLVVHLLSAIVLVGSMFFNAAILGPALKRIPPAQAAAVADKIGAGLRIAGPASLVLLGVSGFFRLNSLGILREFFTFDFMISKIGSRLWLMFGSWLALVVTGTVSAIWYERILARKLPYSAGLRELEERRAAQEKISGWQERLNLINATLGFLAVLGGAMYLAGI